MTFKFTDLPNCGRDDLAVLSAQVPVVILARHMDDKFCTFLILAQSNSINFEQVNFSIDLYSDC